MPVDFSKMHGLGNDFVVFDAREAAIALPPARIRLIADRRRGVGCDQVLLIERAGDPRADVRYRVFNADGSPSEHCGNGVRCVAAYLQRRGEVRENRVAFEIGADVCLAYLEDDGTIRVDMGRPRLEPADIPFVASARRDAYAIRVGERELRCGVVSMGNPHAVMEVADTDQAAVTEIGAALQQHASFPRRVNAGFMQVLGPDHVRLRVYERGVGETPACGTGACAAVVVGRIWGRLGGRVAVDLTGGRLWVQWSGAATDAVWMSGPAVHVFDGKLDL